MKLSIILRASASFRAFAWSRILSTDSASRCFPSAFAWAVAWKRFRSMYRVADCSLRSSSIGSAGRCRAASSARSRSHSARLLPSRSAAISTSRSSSGVIRVATVLVRKPGFSSTPAEAFRVAGVLVPGVLKWELSCWET